jgi:hypothetical protein
MLRAGELDVGPISGDAMGTRSRGFAHIPADPCVCLGLLTLRIAYSCGF